VVVVVVVNVVGDGDGDELNDARLDVRTDMSRSAPVPIRESRGGSASQLPSGSP
jgi:hypothetical protein